jgi:hypothetical protein
MKTYQAKYNPLTNKGVYGISLVENPAMDGLFIALSKDEVIQFKTVNEEQRILMGLVLEPNKPIYRNQNGEEFNIVFNEETIKDLSYGFFKNNSHSNSTIEHDIDQNIKGVTFTESWIVENPTNDKSNNFGFSYPKGSWVAVMKVDSDEVWNDYVKTGKVQGFSIDAMLSLEEVNLKSNIEMSKQDEKSFIELLKDLPNQIKLALNPKAENEIKLGSMMLADGSVKIEYEGDEMKAGDAIWVTADDGTKVPVPVGEHPMEDGTICVVEVEGICKEMKPAEAPAADTPPPAQDMGGEDGKVSNDAKIASEIESAIKSILIKYTAQETKISELETLVAELSKQPAIKPIRGTQVQVDFSKMTPYEKHRELNKKFN